MSPGSGIAVLASSAGVPDLAAYRTRITNSLDDSNAKYTNAIIDEALRKVLNEYTRAFPNINSAELTVTTAGRSQSLNACSNLMVVIQLLHPYDSTAADPFVREREDFNLTWQDGSPIAYFKSVHIPQVGEKIFVKYAARQTVKDLDFALATTVRDDHEDLLIVGAAGQAAMIRASGLTEKWGTIPNQQSNLLLWGRAQYQRFLDFLIEIRSEQPIDIFSKSGWRLDQWDQGV